MKKKEANVKVEKVTKESKESSDSAKTSNSVETSLDKSTDKEESKDESQESEKSEPNPKDLSKKISIFDIPITTKQFIISHSLILLFGLTVLFGMYFYLNSGNPKFDIKNYYPVTRKPLSLSLSINSPDNNSLVFDKSLLISGSSEPFATIIINNLKTEESFGTEADSKGEFSQIIGLDLGPNEISMTTFDSSGNSKTEERDIYFADEKLE